jgi:hypothetical protein
MTDLTPEEKQKIYLEEKTRLEAKEKLEAEKKALDDEKKKKSQKNTGIGCGVIILILAVLYIISQFSPSKSSNKGSSTPHLNASVRFTGTQIVIQNNDSFEWNNLRIELNSGLLNSGYYLDASSIKAGTTATVGILNFAKSNGERFNPISMKARTVTIMADTPSGRGIYTGKWD